MLRVLFLTSAILLWPFYPAVAETDQPDLSHLQILLGDAKPDSITPSAVPGLYEVVVDSHVLYLSKDGRFVVQGDIIDLNGRSNLTENRRGDLRMKAIEAVGENNMVVFAPDNPKHTVTVFTDVDCAYCRKLHQEIADYNQRGIKIRYLLFPRTGIGSESYDKAVAVWCADNRQDALTRAKRGEDIEQKTCPNPVKDQFELGQVLGIRGTPSLILENGQMVSGYVPAARLAQILDGKPGK